jgi:Uma2 family endonuclease
MNELTRAPKAHPTTQAAEGLPRLKWTVAEFDRLAELGLFTEDDRIELIGGELVPMSPKGNRHELVRDELLNWFVRRLPERIRLSSEIGWRPTDDIYLEPDLLLYPTGFSGITVPGREVMLAVEVADSSLKFDTGAKATQYAALGVREYWVVNTVTLETRVHRDPRGAGYNNRVDVPAEEELVPLLAPDLGLRLSALGIS